jgi:hypothetical protein
MTPVEVRDRLVQALGLDLIGPDRGSEHLAEILPQPPSRWYLTGFLVPQDAPEPQRSEETSGEGADVQNDAGGDLDAGAPEPAAARRAFFPSSMGLSLLVPNEAKSLRVTVRWGDYSPLTDLETAAVEAAADGPATDPASRPPRRWQRTDRREEANIPLARLKKPTESLVPNSNELYLVLSVRPVPTEVFEPFVPRGTRSVSLFLVNRRKAAPDTTRDQGYVFQTALEVHCDVPFTPRPNLRGLDSDDWDERVADLQYHDACEFAVGHNVATRAEVGPDGSCFRVETRWIPGAEVERVAPVRIDGVELGMEALAALPDAETARTKLAPMVAHYRAWIAAQHARIPDKPKNRRETGGELLRQAEFAAKRIEAGIALLHDPAVFDAFRLANRVMAASARQRDGMQQKGTDPTALPSPKWRPFQLAFLLMNLRGIAEPGHADRDTVDLLFFPTGGGKTEAYFGLAAFTLVLRRLRHPGPTSAGVSVLMRYTLRLLTLDQLNRAATLICALERERQQDVTKLGEWPFEIGLWVGRAATPNEMGKKNDGNPESARARTIRYKNNTTKAPPIPLETCPWCGDPFGRDSFQLSPNEAEPSDLRVLCLNRSCYFNRHGPLPLLAVDEPIYRRLPCFLIATVDKFAAMPWTGEVGAFFGRVQRFDKHGFYGPCASVSRGAPLSSELPPPDLIIQDELHLISGPMGTMVGLYEAALDALCARETGGKTVRPKIVASTATVRRAEKQIRALFNRRTVDVFPPPGPDRRDSFFARTHRPEESHARVYLGVAAQGRSLKVVLLRVYLALLAAAQKCWQGAGGRKNRDNPADPYMTLLGYFNSLRELGGSRRIVEDEVTTRVTSYGKRRREGEKEGPFADREIAYDVVELTSRVSTDQVALARRRLGTPFDDTKKESVDVAIATNMISVGLDVPRLGLMVVLGQPKTSAEYIQATSRVGRDPQRPGLVVTLLNVHRPRDRSHYERFAAYHQTFYRSVEASSVTPFSPRALERGLVGVLVALARHAHPPMTPPKGATSVRQERGRLEFVTKLLARRAAEHADQGSATEAEALAEKVRLLAVELLDDWAKIARELYDKGGTLQYQKEAGDASRLLYEFLSPDLKSLTPRQRKFRANRSMRNVEPAVNLWVRNLDNVAVEDEG